MAGYLIDVLHGGGRNSDSPRITANVKRNSIVACGSVRELEEIKDIIKLLDAPQLGPGDSGSSLATHDVAGGDQGAAKSAPGQPAVAPTTMKQLAVYRLRYAATSQAMSVLIHVFRSVDSLNMVGQNSVNNSIIAIGGAKTIREIVALLQILDIPRTAAAVQAKSGSLQPSATQLKVFHLIYADALPTATMLHAAVFLRPR